MTVSLEKSAFALFEKVCQFEGMKNNVLFSPYSLQQAFSLLAVNTQDERVLHELELYVSSELIDEALLNTKSGTLMLLSDEFAPYRVYREKGRVELFSSPDDGSNKIIAFQRQQLGEILLQARPEKNDGLGLYAALHYMAEWMTAFDKLNTLPRPFYLENGEKILTKTMSTEFPSIYGKITKDYEVAALPGKKHSITYFVKPKIDKKVILQQLWAICNDDSCKLGRPVLFEMPKVSMKSMLSVKPILKSLNMPCLANNLFTVDNVLNRDKVCTKINAIQQAVQLCLDEERAKVKSVTAIPLACILRECIYIKPKPLVIKMDSPYFVVVKDKTPSGSSRIICTAWISNP